jgi:hypothetical protein
MLAIAFGFPLLVQRNELLDSLAVAHHEKEAPGEFRLAVLVVGAASHASRQPVPRRFYRRDAGRPKILRGRGLRANLIVPLAMLNAGRQLYRTLRWVKAAPGCGGCGRRRMGYDVVENSLFPFSGRTGQ